MADKALDSLQGTLNRILNQYHHPDIGDEIISILDEANVWQLHLPNHPEILKERIREAANTAEEIIEYLISEDNPSYSGWMKPTVEHLNQLREAAEELKSTVRDAELLELKDASSSTRTATTIKDVVVGLDEDLMHIKCQLSSYPSQLQVVSIVGMGGTGKTTLSKLVYNDESIVMDFKIRAWVTVSQDYSVGSIMLDLLASLKGGIPVEKDEERQIPTESLIRGYLMRGRYLVVVDDMWSKKAWDDLKMLFPDTNSGSRIILTTRLHDVAAYVDSSCSNIHTMRLLEAHHSWDLLKKKVFADESCPFVLEDVGKRIVKNCGGLPLSVVVVAGILCKIGKDRRLWKKIAENDGDLETIISLSYNHLPDHLKDCLLYMGGFPEDYEIRVSELIRLWNVEGLLECPTGSKSLEEEAADCLENLVERSLVLVGSRKVDGKIKSCSLHDIVRDFCVKQGEQKKIILSVMDYLPSPILRKHFLPRILKNHRRISATCHDLDFKGSVQTSFPHSIICIPRRGYRSVGSVEKFSSLRVFHVLRRNDNWEWEAGQVYDLIYLTYLAFKIPTSIVPPAISKLQNLQTLIIYRFEVLLPVEIWSLRQLRHLIAFSFLPLPIPEGATSPLENLETISMVMNFICNDKIVEMMSNTKKLRISLSDEGMSYENFDEERKKLIEGFQLDNLVHLCQLEKFKLEFKLDKYRDTYLSYGRRHLNPIFPPSLKKLTLCGWEIRSEEMSIIGSLPNLQVLKLRNYLNRGYRWETIEGEFGELRLLLIEQDIMRSQGRWWSWKTESSHFPKLECLILYNCPHLFEIPSEIGDIPTLKLIEVDMPLLRWAQKIEEKQRQSGNDSFQVRTKKRS